MFSESLSSCLLQAHMVNGPFKDGLDPNKPFPFEMCIGTFVVFLLSLLTYFHLLGSPPSGIKTTSLISPLGSLLDHDNQTDMKVCKTSSDPKEDQYADSSDSSVFAFDNEPLALVDVVHTLKKTNLQEFFTPGQLLKLVDYRVTPSAKYTPDRVDPIHRWHEDVQVPSHSKSPTFQGSSPSMSSQFSSSLPIDKSNCYSYFGSPIPCTISCASLTSHLGFDPNLIDIPIQVMNWGRVLGNEQ